MARKVISPGGRLSGLAELPGDKSISHRYAILAALAEGTSEISNYASAADCQSTLACLRRLGVRIEPGKDRLRIAGVGLEGLKPPGRALDAENSGSTMRLLAGVLAGQPFPSTLTGDRSLRKRPMARIADPLRKMGATIETAAGERAPLAIRGGGLHGIDYTLPVPSAQVKSAVLLAGLYADRVTTVRESVRTRDHTELALREFGATVDLGRSGDREEAPRPEALAPGEARTGPACAGGFAGIHPRPKLHARQLTVPGDLSAAVFLLAAALILPDSELMVHDVGLNPTRTRVLDFLIGMGATINVASLAVRDGELAGDIAVRHSPLAGGRVCGAQVAEMIDELPMLAALGPYSESGIEIRDAGELRVKESDRIAALSEALRRMGATVEEFPDGMRVAGGGKLRGARVDPLGDHRIAMALAVAALGADGETTILDAQCAAVSFPSFFETLARLRDAST
ncbi:MAG TPA: 3-phosphoshikimate 1-carboxyvinyltransferase [Candidatus Cybelea sp.]|nr:3-phosphoshikimate 1-carboxyvinyltransferase [Candidatus Cybelea sp.]